MDLPSLLHGVRRLSVADRRRLLAALCASLRGPAATRVSVQDADGRPLAPCVLRRASELVARGRARWREPGVAIQLIARP